MNPVTAWGLAAILAFTPNLVLLSVQLRGYSIALLAISAALYALDRAFADSSRRWLLLHFAALTVAILAEFMTAWIALAMGMYGLLRLIREPERRSLLSTWVGGQLGALGLYAVLYLTIVRSIVEEHTKPGLVETYLRGAFPRLGENWLIFTGVGSFKQVIYITGSLAGGSLATVFLLAGLGYWFRIRHSLLILVLALGFTVIGAFAEFYPYGRGRHTVALGLVTLVAIGAGIELLARYWQPLRWAAPAAILALSFLVPMSDVHNLPMEMWRKENWDRALTQVQRLVRPGSTILADDEALQMLQARLAVPSDRARFTGVPNALFVEGITVQSRIWDWRHVPSEWVVEQAHQAKGSVWLLDTGFNVGEARDRWRELGAEIVVEEPGVLILARLRPVSTSSKLSE